MNAERSPYPERTAVERWVGGGILRGPRGPVHATWPLMVMSLEDGARLELRIRPRLLAAMFAVRPMTVSSSERAEIFPALSRFGTHYLGVRASSEAEGYFASFAVDVPVLLSLLERQGFAVSRDIRQLPRLWS